MSPSEFAASILSKAIAVDTETTGVGKLAEVVQVGAYSPHDSLCFNSKPLYPIPEEMVQIHGITNQMVMGEASLAERLNELTNVIASYSIVVFYNAPYDLRMIRNSLQFSNHPDVAGYMEWLRAKSICLMKLYADYFNHGMAGGVAKGRYSLDEACMHQGVVIEGSHNALQDATKTYKLLRAVAGYYD